MKLLITGDLAVTEPYQASILINKEVKDLFANSDINILNLEAPVTETEKKILKTGPNLKSDRDSVVDVFKTLKVDVVTLANNHLMDYGEEGVADTLQFCKDNGVKTVGGGMNLKEASQTLYLDSKEGKIAIVNFAENEWVAASEISAGFNPMDIIDNSNQIKEAKEKADYVIVIIHGGHEYYNLPSPRMVKQYRFYAEQGADIVVGHHTHCINGNEIHKEVPIYYSLGNFLFTKSSTYEDWYTGLILDITIENGELSTKVHSVKQSKMNFELALKTEIEEKKILERIVRYNTIIQNEELLNTEWEKYVKEKSNSYLNYWSPISFIKNKYIQAGLRKLNLNLRNKKTLALYLNLMRCETHNDLNKQVLKRYLGK